MKGLDLNSIKDRETTIESTQESLKDVGPLFNEEENNMFWENKRMKDLEREISIHKDLWCKYKCKANGLTAMLYDEDNYFKDKDNTCKLCQIDDFIRELISQRVI